MKTILFSRDQKRDLIRVQPTFEELFDVICSDRAATAAVWLEHGREQKYSYEEFRSRVMQCAARISDARFSAPGSWAALSIENDPDWPVLFWALLASGRKPLPILHSLPPRLKERILSEAGCRDLIIADSRGFSRGIRCTSPRELLSGPASRTFTPRWANRIALCSSDGCRVYVYDGRAVCQQVDMLIEYMEGRCLTREEHGAQRVLCLLPFSDSFALITVLIAAAFMGNIPVYAAGHATATLAAQCRRLKTDQLCIPPIFADKLFSAAMEKQAAMPVAKRRAIESSQRFSLFLQRLSPEKGMATARHLLQELTDRRLLGTSLRQITLCGGVSKEVLTYIATLGYGMAFGCGAADSGVTLYDASVDIESRTDSCSGSPLPGVRCDITADGELAVRSTALSRGQLTGGCLVSSLTDANTLFATGKKAHFDPRGRLHITGGIRRTRQEDASQQQGGIQ